MTGRRLFLALFASSGGLFAAPAGAEDDTDSARARAARERGDIQPLAAILAAVEERYDGRVIETELEYRHDVWIYEFKLLPPTGHM